MLNKLFFFAGYERTRIRQTRPDNIAYVPTPAMMAGDFTTYASPQCNAGRQVTLRPPFVNNRINPASFSPQAVSILNSGWLPSSNDPCGFVQYDVNFDNNDEQIVTRVDYQHNANHTIFGRYIDTFERRPPKLGETHNIMTIQAAFLPTATGGRRRRPWAARSSWGTTW